MRIFKASLLLSAIAVFHGIVFPQIRIFGGSGKGKKKVSQEEYVADILNTRRLKDTEFSDRKWSALAVAAIAHLNRPKTTIGSGSAADLHLDDARVSEVHAEVLREEVAGSKPVFRLHVVEGKVWYDTDPLEEMKDGVLESGSRFRVGRYVVYWSNLGTFGPVVRALDFTSPAYTHFGGLSYFPPDPSYKVQAVVKPYPKMIRVMVADTHGWQRPAWRYGEASFTLMKQKMSLILLLFTPEPKPEDTFFIAFTDQTRGKETYPAARYLEPHFVASGPITLDFNLASNPLCAYNQGFACPLPPRENRLLVPIQAGEKIYPHAVGEPHR